jgi:hypothetical protein
MRVTVRVYFAEDSGFRKNTGIILALAREILDITVIPIHEPGKRARFEMTVPKRSVAVPH